MQLNILDTFFLLLGSALLLLVIAAFIKILFIFYEQATGKTKVVLQTAIDIIEPQVKRAVFYAESLALKSADELDNAIQSEDKTAIANSLYDLLPDTFVFNGVAIPVSVIKFFVTREKFQELVKNEYESAHSFLMKNEDYLKSQVDAWSNTLDSETKTNTVQG